MSGVHGPKYNSHMAVTSWTTALILCACVSLFLHFFFICNVCSCIPIRQNYICSNTFQNIKKDQTVYVLNYTLMLTIYFFGHCLNVF